FQGDAEVYRAKEEVAELRKHDPIPALAATLKRRHLLDDTQERAIGERAGQRVDAAFQFARASAYPAADDAARHVFH
ncbi:MAG: pyruvate dehydrogenase (acetyl-transferring) E1 component subunit alpha, partial [Comamonadaceae bacterium]